MPVCALLYSSTLLLTLALALIFLLILLRSREMAANLIDTELFNIFTYYALHGDPLDPEHMRASQLTRLSRDCQIVGPGLLMEADVAVAFQAEVTRVEKVAPGSQKPHSVLKMAPVRVVSHTATDRKKVRLGCWARAPSCAGGSCRGCSHPPPPPLSPPFAALLPLTVPHTLHPPLPPPTTPAAQLRGLPHGADEAVRQAVRAHVPLPRRGV